MAETTETPSIPPSPSERRILVARSGRAMATDVSVQLAVAPQDADRAAGAADACMAWLAEVDQRLSRFRPESDLSQLNRTAGSGGWFAASDVLFAAVVQAIEAAHASDGLFDPTLLPQIVALGYDRDFSLIAHQETPPATDKQPSPPTPSTGSWRAIQLDSARRRIRLPANTQLDLGGVAKGWAADVAVERFCAPFAHVLVNVGGDLRLRGGPAPGQAWSVGVRDPRAEASAPDPSAPDVATITFSRGGLATSGSVRRWWLRGGERRHHLIDPRTGQSLRLWIDERDDNAPGSPLIATATALAPTAAQAEVAAKVALLRGYPAALRAVEAAWAARDPFDGEQRADASVALVLVLGSGEVALSANLPDYVATWGCADTPIPLSIAVPPAPRERSAPHAPAPR